MPDDTFPHLHSRFKIRDRTSSSFLVFLVILWLVLVPPASAGESIEIVISGIEGDLLKNVRETLVLPAGLAGTGTVDRLWLAHFAQQAVGKTRSALEPLGYYNPVVTATVEPDNEIYRLLVKVDVGEPVRLSDVSVTVDGPGSEEKRLRRQAAFFPLKKGDILLHQPYEEAKDALRSSARDLGYLNAEFSRHEIRIDESATTATIELILDTDERFYFGATKIQGAPDYPEKFLRRHLTYRSGELFSYPRLGETQRNFINSERFKEVIVTPELATAADYLVPITVKLQAAPRRNLRLGIGYGTDTGGRFTARYRDMNMLHLGHEFYSQIYVAERLQGLVSGYILPGSRDIRSSTALQLNLQQEETSTYSSRIEALELSFNRGFDPGQLGAAYVKAQYEDYTVGTENSFSRLLLPGLRYSNDRYDNPVRPRRGFRYAFELRGTHQLLGSDTALTQILAEGSHLLPLPWRLSLHTRAKTAITLFSDPLKDIPPSLRFFAGGDQSVRGYSYKSLGPRDASGRVMGGRQLLFGSLEVERALLKNWSVSLFYDAGNAFNSFLNASTFQGAGVGLHYYSAVGALNLSMARSIGVDNPAYHLHFTVGFEL